MDAELDESSVDDVTRTEDRIVSQWREVSADEQHQLRERFEEILRPLGFVASLVVIRRANSLVLIFHCMTVSALMSLRHQWSSGQLKDILESLFTLLSAATRIVRVKNIKWPLADYERYLSVIKSLTVRSCVVNRKLWHLNDYRCLVI